MLQDNKTPHWYVVHTYSGYENKVATNLEKIVENRNLGHLIHSIKVPVEEIEGEDGNILIDRIQTPTEVRFYPRQAPASGQEKRVEGELLSKQEAHNEYYYEVAEFINLILEGRRESQINSHDTSLATMEIIDEVRRQLGVHYPADEQ